MLLAARDWALSCCRSAGGDPSFELAELDFRLAMEAVVSGRLGSSSWRPDGTTAAEQALRSQLSAVPALLAPIPAPAAPHHAESRTRQDAELRARHAGVTSRAIPGRLSAVTSPAPVRPPGCPVIPAAQPRPAHSAQQRTHASSACTLLSQTCAEPSALGDLLSTARNVSLGDIKVP